MHRAGRPRTRSQGIRAARARRPAGGAFPDRRARIRGAGLEPQERRERDRRRAVRRVPAPRARGARGEPGDAEAAAARASSWDAPPRRTRWRAASTTTGRGGSPSIPRRSTEAATRRSPSISTIATARTSRSSGRCTTTRIASRSSGLASSRSRGGSTETRLRIMRTWCAPVAVTAWNRWSRCSTSRIPVWLAEAGGFAAPEAPVRFARYAAACVEALGDAVTWWVTVNEPTVVAVLGHLEGQWPPGERSLRRTLCRIARSAAHARGRSTGDHDRLRTSRTPCAGLDRASRASPRSPRRVVTRRSGACPDARLPVQPLVPSQLRCGPCPSARSDTARWCPGSQGRSRTWA